MTEQEFQDRRNELYGWLITAVNRRNVKRAKLIAGALESLSEEYGHRNGILYAMENDVK